jgi:hypothetical protein
MDQPSAKAPDSGKPGDGTRDEGEPIRLIIQDLAVKDAKVVIRAGIPGLDQEIVVPVPSFQVKEIGTGEGNKNGAAIKEVVMLVVTTLAEKASESKQIPDGVRQLLNLNADQIQARLGSELNKQIEKVTKDLGKDLPKDLDKTIQEGIGGLLNQNRNRQPSTQPR